jgi:hypothetical protein
MQQIIKHLTPTQLKIEALRSISERLSLDAIIGEMVVDGVFSQKDIEIISFHGDQVEGVYEALFLAEKRGDIQMLDFEWRILPHKLVVVKVVTPKGLRVWTDG